MDPKDLLQTFVKVFVSVGVILTATAIAKEWPSLGGLIGTMPLTALLIMIWLHVETKGDSETMRGCVTGAFFGVLPTLAFFGAAVVCYRRGLSVPFVLALGFAAWLAGAAVHQIILGRKKPVEDATSAQERGATAAGKDSGTTDQR